ncbi:aspartate kinase [Bacillota bacterium Meth-B3]|nr:aspartate kinase [Christensenellaceae bacterium]MEA5065644.1 aspartate kinase [Eubacteriales bacterium]MEA5068855.1 aspartate kinase [Christensenellaceae bacterium]
MGVKVCKFGGSSLADAGQFQKVRAILLSDPSRRYVVPSAPGKRGADDEKITDMLYRCYQLARRGESYAEVYAKIKARYIGIVQSLGLALDIEPLLDETDRQLADASPDFAASRGEYFSGLVLASYLGWDFVDPKDMLKFDRQGAYAAEWSNELAAEELKKHAYAVVPGFYGSLPGGEVRTFSRGGSDITGAVIARAVNADLYENWTDVSGFLMADPRIVDNPHRIEQLTYRELRELSYMGATVLHEDSVFPVRRAGIPINIRNTNAPDDPGTLIVVNADDCGANPITGVAGHKNFTLLSIEKAMMNSEIGFGRRVLQALEDFGVSFEHLPTGIDTMCVIIADSALKDRREQLIEHIEDLVHPDSIELSGGLALIATVGRGMVRTPGTAARLFSALAREGINVRMIDQGSSELNIIVGVDVAEFEHAVRAIYDEFVERSRT